MRTVRTSGAPYSLRRHFDFPGYLINSAVPRDPVDSNITPIFNSFFQTKRGRYRPDRPNRPFPRTFNAVAASADRPGIVRNRPADDRAPPLRNRWSRGAGNGVLERGSLKAF